MPIRVIHPDFYVLTAAGEIASDIARRIGVDDNTIRNWARYTGTELADGRSDLPRGAERDRFIAMNDGKPLGEPRSKYFLFRQQKKGAYKRGIGWAMSYEEWHRIWSDSGKWDVRGSGKGKYVMARNGDVGPYAIGNVRIIPFEQNVAERWSNNGGRRFKLVK